MQVIKYNKKYADSVNMTLELYRSAIGWVPDAADLKGIFNWDSNYREEICRNLVLPFELRISPYWA